MNDPHVTAVNYELVFEKDFIYAPPPGEITYLVSDFQIAVEGLKVAFRPEKHFADRASARAKADAIVGAWELKLAMDLRTLGVALEYVSTDLVDRAPTPGVIEVQLEATALATVTCAGTLTRTFRDYVPRPDADFIVTPNVESLWQRYRMHKEGKEPLLGMAYFCLTLVRSHAGGLGSASQAFNIELQLLRKIGELTSTRGDMRSARKMSSAVQSLSSVEQSWVDEAVRSIILQVGRSSNGPSSFKLRMAHLPALTQ